MDKTPIRKSKFSKNFLIAAVLLATSVFLLMFLVSTSARLRDADIEHPPLTDGVFDMRGVDFEQRQAHALYMTYQFYPGEYKSPAELDGIAPVECKYHSAGDPSAMFRFNILLPDDQPYYIEFAVPGHSGKLFVNGELADDSLPFGRDTEGVGYTYQYKAVMTPENGRLDIVMAVKAYDDGTYNWSYVKVSDPGLQAQFENRLVMLDAFFIGALALSFALFFVLFFLMGMKRENLYFAFICLVMALRRCVVSARLVYLVLPDFPYAIKIEHLTLILVIPFLALYLSRVFPKLFQKPVLAGIAGNFTLYTLLVAFTPYSFYRSFLTFFYAVTAAAMLYIFVRFFISRRMLNLEQTIALTGLLTLCLAIANDVLYYSGNRFSSGIGFYEIMEQAMLIFVLMQMVSLFLSNARQTAEARQAERSLAEQNAALERLNQLKTEFLSNVSHELKTPLTVMSGYAQTAGMSLSEMPESEELSSQMKLITSEADRLALMVEQILDVTRIDEGRMAMALAPSSATEIIQTTVSTYYPVLNKNHNKLALKLPEKLPEVLADPARISQVLVNLLSNAIRHTHNGHITIEAKEKVGFVEISVADTGDGIAPERIPFLFERYKSHEKTGSGIDTGTGLGLFICKYIVDAHGGEIAVESAVDKGTTVRFTLPTHS